jgi:intein/homing endonuclease
LPLADCGGLKLKHVVGNVLRKKLPRILEMLLRLEIGRKLAETDGYKPGFVRSGVTEACLNLNGKVPREEDT